MMLSTFSRRTLAALSLGVAAAVTACGPLITRQAFESTTARPFYQYAAGGKQFLLEVHRSPQGVTPAALAEVMPSPPGFAPTEFTASVQEAALPDYRFVLVFDVPAAFDGQQACSLRGAQPTTVAATSADNLHAAFCHEETVVSELRATEVSRALGEGLESQAARRFLSNVGRELLPPQDIDRDTRCRPPTAGGC